MVKWATPDQVLRTGSAAHKVLGGRLHPRQGTLPYTSVASPHAHRGPHPCPSRRHRNGRRQSSRTSLPSLRTPATDPATTDPGLLSFEDTLKQGKGQRMTPGPAHDSVADVPVGRGLRRLNPDPSCQCRRRPVAPPPVVGAPQTPRPERPRRECQCLVGPSGRGRVSRG